MTVYGGQGDPRRSIALLWRAPRTGETRPGPKPGLSVDAIVEAAVSVADEQGMAALSMRSVGERLGRTGMALYTYVPGKDELLDLMYDHVLGELPGGYDLGGGWRPAAESWADDLLGCCLRHPWVLQVSQARPILGPHDFRALEALAAILRSTGLPARTLRGAVAALYDLVRGAARTIADSRQAPRDTGTSDEEWWQARAAAMAEVAPDFAAGHPALTWLQGQDAEPFQDRALDGFRGSLALLLDGVEAARLRTSAQDGPGPAAAG
ncbi:MAG: TetR/AcrR family transcriptional regulator [Nonomuraea sp.]|nr:TetR/AcrR family transcriptional regulator [Nonomuraea sp.]